MTKKRSSRSSRTLTSSEPVESIDPTRWNKNRLNGILAQNQGKKILVIGDVGLDRYTIGSVERISPEAPVPIVLVEDEKLKLGLAANVADNIHALGGVPLLVGLVGKDRGAEDFRALLHTGGLQDQHLVVDSSRRTVLKERVVSELQQLVRIDYESLHPVEAAIEKKVMQKVLKLLPKVDGVVVEDYAKGLISASLTAQIFRAAKKAGKRVVVDPNTKTPASVYVGASILTPNTKEAENLSGILIRDPATLRQAGFKILKATAAEHVVMTRGKDGMAIFSRGTSTIRIIPTYAREVYDVSGAGDTVVSVLALSLISGASIEEASVLGNLAAGLEVGKRGTATVSPDEIRRAMDLLEFFK